MAQKSGYYQSENYVAKIYYNIFTPENKKPKATILIIHGMQEYSTRYAELAEFLAGSGFTVMTYDQPGHGKSVTDKKDLGFFQTESPDMKLIDTADQMGELLHSTNPDIPQFILGHSMGSFVERCLLNRNTLKFNGAVIVGTGSELAGINLLISFFSIMNKIAPRKIAGFNKVFNFMNNSKFRKENPDSHINWLSVNVQNRENYEKDEMCGFPFTNNGFYTLFKIYKKATDRNWASDIDKNFPFFFISGENDNIGNFGKAVGKIISNLKSDGFTQINSKTYKDVRHEILNEDIKKEVFNDIQDWITGQIK